MYQSFMNLEEAQKVALLTTFITAIIAIVTLLYTIRINKNTVYSNSVTRERIDSMKSLKINASKFNGLIYNFLSDPQLPIDRQELYILKNLIEYQLNENRLREREILVKINNIIQIHNFYFEKNFSNIADLKKDLNNKGIDYLDELIFKNKKRYLLSVLKIEFELYEEYIRKHIKSEWDKIKSEVDI